MSCLDDVLRNDPSETYCEVSEWKYNDEYRRALRNNDYIDDLTFLRVHLGVVDFEALRKSHMPLKSLIMDEPRLTKPALVSLGSMLRTKTTLRLLSIQYDNIGSDELSILRLSLEQCTSLTILEIKGNKIGEAGGQTLARIVSKHPCLTKLKLDSNKLGGQGVMDLCEGLVSNCQLAYLDLDCNNITSSGYTALGAMLERNTSLQCLVLDGNSTNQRGFDGLFQSLIHNTTLYDLGLRECFLDSAVGLSSYINRINLKSLGFQGNPIAPKEAKSLFTQLATNTSLQSLDLGRCNLNKKCINELVHCIKHNTTLKDLILFDNPLERCIPHIEHAMSTNSTLHALRCRGSSIDFTSRNYHNHKIRKTSLVTCLLRVV